MTSDHKQTLDCGVRVVTRDVVVGFPNWVKCISGEEADAKDIIPN